VQRPVPLVREIEAETCAGFAKEVLVADEQADGGRGGKSVLLTPGGAGLTTEINAEPGVYALFVIARNREQKIGHDLMTLEVKEHKTAQVKSWTTTVVYREQYLAVGRMYFPAYAGGRHTVTVRLATPMEPRPACDKAADFADADGGGKAKLRACPFGPGDRMTLDTIASVEGADTPGAWRRRSNTPCTIGLPRPQDGFTKVEISADGKAFAPIASHIEGPQRIITLSDNDLADGKAILKLVKG
jgi:hypothetical protein